MTSQYISTICIISLIYIYLIADTFHLSLDKPDYLKFDLLNATLCNNNQESFSLYSISIKKDDKEVLIYYGLKMSYFEDPHLFQPFVLQADKSYLALMNIDEYLHNCEIKFIIFINSNKKLELLSNKIKIKSASTNRLFFDLVQERRAPWLVQVVSNPLNYEIKFELNKYTTIYYFGICGYVTGCLKFYCSLIKCWGYFHNSKIYVTRYFLYVQKTDSINEPFFVFAEYYSFKKYCRTYSHIQYPIFDYLTVTLNNKSQINITYTKNFDSVTSYNAYLRKKYIDEEEQIAKCKADDNICTVTEGGEEKLYEGLIRTIPLTIPYVIRIEYYFRPGIAKKLSGSKIYHTTSENPILHLQNENYDFKEVKIMNISEIYASFFENICTSVDVTSSSVETIRKITTASEISKENLIPPSSNLDGINEKHTKLLKEYIYKENLNSHSGHQRRHKSTQSLDDAEKINENYKDSHEIIKDFSYNGESDEKATVTSIIQKDNPLNKDNNREMNDVSDFDLNENIDKSKPKQESLQRKSKNF